MHDTARDIDDDADTRGERGGFGSLGSILGALVCLWAVSIAAGPLKDNSFLTHLATGRLILERGSVPSEDPYTFTAEGVDWTVQSWLASVVYAGAERAGGTTGLRVVVLALFVGAALLLWRLTRPATSVVVRIGIVALGMFVATEVWTERPYMVGVIGLAVVWLALDGAVRPWVLVPTMWLWANAHGSFPLAVVLVLAVLAGAALDRRAGRADDDDVAVATHVLGFVALGTVLAVIGPLGPDVLTFPLKALTRSEVLGEIVEWGAPRFESNAERAFLLLVLLTVAGLTRVGRWRLALPAIVFTGAAVLAQRNVVMAVVVLVAVLAACAPELGTLRSATVPSLGPIYAVALVAVVLVSAVAVASKDADTLPPYPGHALAWMAPGGIGREGPRLATPDYVGNLLEALDGEDAAVFVDDRADMFPADVFGDAVALTKGDPSWRDVLDRHDIDVVLWEREEVLGSLLAADPGWQTAYADSRWVVSCRRTAGCDDLRG